MSAVGFTPPDPNEDRERLSEAVMKLRKVLIKAREAFNSRRMRDLDTQLANAWMISGEVEGRLKKLSDVAKQDHDLQDSKEKGLQD
jgi:hypothetical protein